MSNNDHTQQINNIFSLPILNTYLYNNELISRFELGQNISYHIGEFFNTNDYIYKFNIFKYKYELSPSLTFKPSYPLIKLPKRNTILLNYLLLDE